MIIFLNGASSVGKSTIAREIMRQSDRPFLYFSVNHIANVWLDQKFIAFEDEPNDWFYHEQVIDEKGIFETRIINGPNAVQLHWDLIESITVLINKGYDFIIDEVLWDRRIFERYVPALLSANRVYMVKVICDLVECERRESKRKDRFKGLARGLYSQVYQDFPYYDIEIDTTGIAYQKSAEQLLNFVTKNEHPTAFKQSVEKLKTLNLGVDHVD